MAKTSDASAQIDQIMKRKDAMVGPWTLGVIGFVEYAYDACASQTKTKTETA
jgi:hypothetical protein